MSFIGNNYYYNLLYEWLKKPINSKNISKECVCFIIGNHGIGKSYGTKKAIEELNYNLSEFTGNNYKDFIDFIIKQTTSDIVSQFTGGILSKKVILIDEFESLMLYDRTFLNNLIELLDNSKLPGVKIVILSVPFETKNGIKLSDSCNKLHLSVPNETDIFLFLKKNYDKIKNDKLLNISENCDNNISIAITLANDLLYSDVKNKKNIKNYDKTVSLNNIYNDQSLITIRNIIDQDKSLNPLKYHENLIKAVQQRKGTKIKKLDLYKNSLLSLCEWDTMNNHYKKLTNDYDIPLEYISRNILNLYNLPNKKNVSELNTEFTKLFNYLSLKKKSLMTLYNTEIPWYSMGLIHKTMIEDIEKKFSV